MIISYCSEVSKCLLQWADNLMYLRSKPGSTILCFPTIAYLPYGDTKAKLSRVQIAITNGIYYMANLLMAMPLNVFCYVISQVMPMISVPDVDLRKSLNSSQDPELCYYDRNAAGLFHLLASVLILPVILIVAILLPPTNSSIERIIPSEGSSVLKNITRYVCIVFFACTGMFLLSTLIDRMSMAVQDAIEDENQHKKAGRRLTQGFSTPRSGVNLTVQASDRTPRPVFIMTASLNRVASTLKLKQSARVILSFLRETLIIFAPILFFRYNRASLSYYCNPPGAGGSLHIRKEPYRDDFILDPRPNDPDSIELLLVPIPEDPGTTTRSEKGPEIIVDGGMRGCYGE